MRRLATVLFLVVSGCGSIGSVQAHSISLAYKAGDTYKYALHAVLNYTIGAEGFSVPFNLDMTGKETITVKSVEAVAPALLQALDQRNIQFFVVDAPADAFKPLAAAVRGRDVLLFNATAPEDSLRREVCAREIGVIG